MSESRLLDDGVEFLRSRGVGEPRLALVLGSGLKGFGDRIDDAVSVPFGDVPSWPAPRVEGHGGALVVGTVAGTRVACLTGRVHLYEGYTAHEVVRAVRTLRRLGVGRFLLTNAAGGVSPDLAPGDLMVIRDHINLTGTSPLLGPHEPPLGPRFPDQSTVYDAELRAVLHAVDPDLAEGVYAGQLGPAYETPAEIGMAAAVGADAVGMSTVMEATALNAMRARIAAISLISNLAAGISPTPLDHAEVIAAGAAAEGRLMALLQGFCARAVTA